MKTTLKKIFVKASLTIDGHPIQLKKPEFSITVKKTGFASLEKKILKKVAIRINAAD